MHNDKDVAPKEGWDKKKSHTIHSIVLSLVADMKRAHTHTGPSFSLLTF